MTPPLPVWFLAYDGIQALDLTGPFEVFNAANRVLEQRGQAPRFQLTIVSVDGGPIVTESGLAIGTMPVPSGQPPHTLVIAGGDSAQSHIAATDPLVTLVGTLGSQIERLVTICTGAFIAAAAGLFDGLDVTTHWMRADQLATLFPAVRVHPDAIFINEGTIWTSAGVTAGIDLALAIVEADCGVDVAQDVARVLVVFLRRAGGQSQFASSTWTRRSSGGPVRDAQDLIDDDPAAVESIEQLARSVGLSSRQLTRRFDTEVGISPARYLEQVRLAAARQQLEATDDGVAAIAKRCGFGTSETLRRSFQRHLSVSPDLYRQRFTTKENEPCR